MKKILIVGIVMLTNVAFTQTFKGALVFERDEKKGIVDTLGTILLPANFNNVSITDDEQFVVLENDQNKYGILNAKLDTIFSFKYDYISEQNKLFIVSNNEKYGVLDVNKKEKLPIIYKNVSALKMPFQSFTYETFDAKYGIVDVRGKSVLKDVRYYVEPISEKLFLAKIDDDSYFVDRNMKMKYDFPVRYIIPITEKMTQFYIKKEDEYFAGLINNKGQILLQPKYKSIQYFPKTNIYIVETEKGSSLLNEDLKEIKIGAYDKIEATKEASLLKVYKDKKYGFIDTNGNLVINLIYDEAENFSEGLAAVVKDGKWGFINENGATVIDFNYIGKMESFKNGYARFYKGNFTTMGRYTSFRATFIDKMGNYVLEPTYEDIYYISKNKAIGVRNGSKYLVDLKTNSEIFELSEDDRIFQISN